MRGAAEAAFAGRAEVVDAPADGAALPGEASGAAQGVEQGFLIGLAGAYGIYTVAAILSIFFVVRYVRETKGKELEQMEG